MGNIFELFDRISGGRGAVVPEPAGVEWIIAGLGNIGREYEMTRHNIGFMCMDVLAGSLGVRVDRLRFRASTGRAAVNGHGVLLMCPRTYMNSSGEAIRDAAEFYKVPPEKILVFVDDINLDIGRLRFRAGGSDGGHNGLKSIIYQLSSDSFPRIRIGAGKKPPEFEMIDWVLSRLPEGDLDPLKQAVVTAVDSVGDILDGKYDSVMQTCNGFRPET